MRSSLDNSPISKDIDNVTGMSTFYNSKSRDNGLTPEAALLKKRAPLKNRKASVSPSKSPELNMKKSKNRQSANAKNFVSLNRKLKAKAVTVSPKPEICKRKGSARGAYKDYLEVELKNQEEKVVGPSQLP